MSKYTYAPESVDWDYKQYMITVIANELAEANRLKIIELSRTKFCKDCGVAILETTLVDNA